MAENIKKIAESIGGKVIKTLDDVEPSTFGIAELAERLQPSSGKRPGRPTDPSWEKNPKIPMSAETAQTLRRLAERFSTERRRISPMQMGGIILEDEVRAYKEAFDFLEKEPRLGDVWRCDHVPHEERHHPPHEREWAVLEFRGDTGIKSLFLWEASEAKCLMPSILFAGALKEYAHVVIRGDLLRPEQKSNLRTMAEKHDVIFHETMQHFIKTKKDSEFSDEPVLLSHYDTSRLYRFRFPLALVDQPYLYRLTDHFKVVFAVVHATVIGSHGYLDVQLDPEGRNPAQAEKLISFARRLGVAVRPVTCQDFWADLAVDSEEEIRRSLATARALGEDWRSFPPEADSTVVSILRRFQEQYQLFPGHHSLRDWLFKEVKAAAWRLDDPRFFVPMQRALMGKVIALVKRHEVPKTKPGWWSGLEESVRRAA